MSLSGARPSPLKVITDPASATVTYVGWAAPGTATSAAAWKIAKLDFSSGGLDMQWPVAGISFTYVWDDRAAGTYS